MKIAILGTGAVGRTIAEKLASLGHDVTIGTRDVDDLMSRTEGPMGGRLPTFSEWIGSNEGVSVATFEDAAAGSDLVFNATSGQVSLQALESAGAPNLAGKILVDISNPLDFSHGFPPTLSVCNTDSIAEQIQAAFPDARVVKALNTTNAGVMVDPGALAGGDHTMFVAGNDEAARIEVAGILKEWFGWSDVIDLGDLTGARGMEMILPLWLRLMGSLGHANFNFKITR